MREPGNDREEEYKKNPLANLKDSLDRSQMGDLRPISQLGCWPAIIVIALAVAVLLVSVASR